MLSITVLVTVIAAVLWLFCKVITANDKKDSYEYGKLKLMDQKEVER